jgi:hypothetical protein
MTMGGLRRALALCCTLTAVTAAPAAAQQCDAPPGTAAIEQYCETIPSASGPRGGDTEAEAKQPVPPETLRKIEAEGAPGRELGQVLRGAATPVPTSAAMPATPPSRRSKRKPERSATPRPTPTATPVSTGNPLSAVRSALAGGETVGGGFPWVLLGIAAAIGGAGWLRRSRRHDG